MFFNHSHPNSQKYIHENLKHTVIKHLAKKLKSIHTFRQLLPTILNVFQISYRTILKLPGSYSQTILYTYPDIKQCWHSQRVTGKQCYRVYIKQYWHCERVPSKLNYSKNFFQSTYHSKGWYRLFSTSLYRFWAK